MDRFDRWARRRAVAGETGIDRRDLLRRAGVVGAVVAAAPLIQSVTSPAFAASCTDQVDAARGCRSTCGAATCGAGSPCVIDQDCATGRCFGGFCKVPFHAACEGTDIESKDMNCESGYCNGSTCEYENTMKGAGESCHARPPATTAKQCDAGRLLVCSDPVSGTCKGLTGAECEGPDHCMSGVCTATGLCA